MVSLTGIVITIPSMQMHSHPGTKRTIKISSDSDGMLGVEALDAVYSHQDAQVIKKLNTFLTIRLSVYASLALKE